MKIILSRKGFDENKGGTPSPILTDGTLISLPVPQGFHGISYEDLHYQDMTYLDIWKQLKVNQSVFKKECHLNPDLTKDIHDKVPMDWTPIFAQADKAEEYLEKEEVEEGDVFLFFGWFRRTEDNKDGALRYKRGAADQQCVYGYLQIGEIVKGKDVENYPWHLHSAYFEEDPDTNNTMYIASPKLVINGVNTGLPGAGTLKYAEDLLVNLPAQNRASWNMETFFKGVEDGIEAGKVIDGRLGQEFVIPESRKAADWLMMVINRNSQ